MRGDHGRSKQEGCADFIAGKGNVPQHGDAQERFDIGIVRLSSERVPEEDQHVEIAFGDLHADLKVATQRTTEEFGDRMTQFFLQKGTCSAGGTELELLEGGAVFAGPANDVAFLMIVGDDADGTNGH